MAAIGIDFGTTNSSVAHLAPDGELRLARFPSAQGPTESWRSLLYLEQWKEAGATRLKSWSGPPGIEHYLAAETRGRLIQSLKSFLTSRTLESTEVFGRPLRLEDLIARILRDLRENAQSLFGFTIDTAVVGRPVNFVGAHNEDDNLFAVDRLAEAFFAAGFEEVTFEFEPVAAALHYDATLDHDELILIGDFGGGTSDFSLLHVGPSTRPPAAPEQRLLGNSGIGLAGDAFDARLVRNLVSPQLGLGSMARSFDKLLPAVPNWVYSKLERWHHLSFLRTNAVINMLQSTLATAFEPARIEALLHLIREDLGYPLHRSVQRVKWDLSSSLGSCFRFSDGVIDIEAPILRADFETWIAPELAQIETCVDSLLATCAVSPADVDMVFLTGGTSLVPAVRRIFESRFGAHRIRAGHEFTSVARGLALRAAASPQ